jgi:DNA modification methylase
MAKKSHVTDGIGSEIPALGQSPWANNIVGYGVARAADLLAHPGNIKIHPQFQAAALQDSLDSLGWIQNVMVNKRLGAEWGADQSVETMIDGHERVILALRHGDDTPVPITFVNLNPPQENLALLIFDAIASLAIDDTSKLDAATRAAETTKAALQQLIAQRAEKAGLYVGNGPVDVTEDDPPLDLADELREQWGVTSGQLWEARSKSSEGTHRLLCGDCTDAIAVKRLFDEQTAVLLNTDPPYGIDYSKLKDGIPRPGFINHQDHWGDIENDTLTDGVALQAFLERMIRAALPYLDDHSAFYLWHPMLTQGVFFAAAAAAAAADILIHRQIIWVKPGFVLTRSGMYHWKHELCFYGWRRGFPPPWYGNKSQVSVWDIGRDTDAGMHPTQKPIALFVPPIENHTLSGQIIYEPFAGSGSQLCAAEQCGRICYAMEIDSRYVAVCLERLSTLGLEPRLVES